MLSRNGIEEHLDITPSANADANRSIDDIRSSAIFLELKDAHGHPFFPPPVGEGRLVFSLSVDSFDPFGNQAAKQSYSATGLWMVLLNLPWYMRHLRENMYLAGVIPGPTKPSTDAINHFLQLIVDDMLEFWDPGVFYTRTVRNPKGKLFKAMVVPVICDYSALRQVIGYASSSNAHDVCVCCDIDINDISVVERSDWPPKDLDHIRRFATLWKNANSEAHRQSIFGACGWRWSALFDLPYWDPTRFAVVDSMHTIDLNLFQNHCREYFRIDTKYPSGDGLSGARPLPPRALEQNRSLLNKCANVISANSSSLLFELLEFKSITLSTVCRRLNIKTKDDKEIIGTRWVLAREIHSWVSPEFRTTAAVALSRGLQLRDGELRLERFRPSLQEFLVT